MIKRIFQEPDVAAYVGFILAFALMGYWFYFYPDTVSSESSIEIRVVLLDQPRYSDGGEDGDPYIYFDAYGYDRGFIVDHCIINDFRKSEILELNAGKNLTLVVEKKDLEDKTFKIFSRSIKVCGLKSSPNEWIFELDEYNNCMNRSWTKFLYYGIIIGLALLPSTIKKIKTMANNGEHP